MPNKGADMKVESLKLYHFRNYSELFLKFTANVNIFLGANAQGKTNILEALYFGAMGRSHRTWTDNEAIQWQQQQGGLHLLFSRAGVENSLSFKLIVNQNKEIILNGHMIKQRELIGCLNIVMFSPEDLMLIKGAPAGRRKFLDSEISQASPSYYRQLVNYNKILSQRNMLLKKIREKKSKSELLEEWDIQLAKAAAVIVSKRLLAVKKLTMLANLMHRKITNNRENLAVSYFCCGSQNVNELSAEWYRIQYQSMRREDIGRGSTSIGPHRDDIIFTVNGMNLRNFGSQGQQRTGVLATKLAELEFLKSETGEYPILLLDDVMSELDSERREQLLSFIKDRIQTFITATEPKYFSDKKLGKYYTVHAGQVDEMN